VASWPQLQELRSAAESNPTSCHDRRRHAATSLAACSRAEMTAALIAQRGRGPGVNIRTEVDAATVVLGGQIRHASLRTLCDGGLRTLAASWHLPERDVRTIESSLRTVIGPQAVFGAASLPSSASSPSDEVSDFALAPLLFGEALAAGWPWALAMRLFSGLRRGRSCAAGLGFLPERGKDSPPPPGGGVAMRHHHLRGRARGCRHCLLRRRWRGLRLLHPGRLRLASGRPRPRARMAGALEVTLLPRIHPLRGGRVRHPYPAG
jgi:hypothetical protein